MLLSRPTAAALAAVGLCAALVAACSATSGGGGGAGNGLPTGTGSYAQSHGKIDVVAGENFWGNITAQIGGRRVHVTSIINDPNTDPHEYQSNVDDAAAIAHADLVIENGAGYDEFISKLLSANSSHNRKVLNVAKLVGAKGDDVNPHLWYDPAYVISAARAIESQLAAADPSSSQAFAANLRTFLAGEQQVSNVIAQIKAKYQGTAIAYTERVPGYLVLAAGLHLGTPASFSQSIEDGTDPSPIDNAVFEKDITDHKVKVLLYNAQVTDTETKHLRSLARSSGVPVVGVTETMPTDETNFQSWQADQAKALLAALGG